MTDIYEKVSVKTIEEAAPHIEGHLLVDFFNSDDGLTFVVFKNNTLVKIVFDDVIYTYLPYIPKDMFACPVNKFVPSTGDENKPCILLLNSSYSIDFAVYKNDTCGLGNSYPCPFAGQLVNQDTWPDFLSAMSLTSGAVEFKSRQADIKHGCIPKDTYYVLERRDPINFNFIQTVVIPATLTGNTPPKDTAIIFHHYIGYA